MRMKSICLFIILILFSGVMFADNISDSKSLYDKASVLVKQGNKTSAIPILRKSISLNSNNFWAKKLLVDILTEKGEKLYNSGYEKTAFQYFKEAVKYWSNHQTAAYWYRKLKPQAGQLKDKVKEKKQPTKDKKDDNKKSDSNKKIDKKNDTKKHIKRRDNRRDRSRNIVLSEKQFKRLLKLQQKNGKTDELAQEKESVFPLHLIIIGSIVGLLLLIVILMLMRKIIKGTSSKSGKKSRITIKNDKTMAIYNDLIRMQKMDELVLKIESGELDWNVIKQYLGELDRKIRIEILSIIENKIYREIQPLSHTQAELLMCLLMDGDEYIRKKSNLLLSRSIVDASRPAQLAISNNTTLALPPVQDIYQNEYKRRQTDYFLDVSDLRGLIPLAKIVDRKVFNTNHSTNVAQGSYQLGVALGFTPEESNLFYIAGLAHNIGYLDIPSDLFQKEDELDKEETSAMQQHPKRGIELLDFTKIPQVVADGILYHHEKWDGTGYPEGLIGEEIPVVARAISIMDVFYALIASRPYRDAKPKKEAATIIKKFKGKSFDPKIVEIFNFLIKQNVL